MFVQLILLGLQGEGSKVCPQSCPKRKTSILGSSDQLFLFSLLCCVNPVIYFFSFLVSLNSCQYSKTHHLGLDSSCPRGSRPAVLGPEEGQGRIEAGRPKACAQVPGTWVLLPGPLVLWLLGMTPSKALTMLTAQTCVFSARDGLEGWFPSSVYFAVFSPPISSVNVCFKPLSSAKLQIRPCVRPGCADEGSLCDDTWRLWRWVWGALRGQDTPEDT